MHVRTVDKNGLKETLFQACFADSSKTRQEMNKALEQMEYAPDFLWCLARCVNLQDLGKDLPSECRQLAAILLKTFTIKHWQPTPNSTRSRTQSDDSLSEVDHPLTIANRQAIKEFLLSYLHEPDCKVAVQLSFLTAKIALFDFPNQWPELISTLIKYIQNNDSNPLQGFRASFCLHDVLIELASNRMDSSFQQFFQDLCTVNFSHVVRAWANNSKYIQSHLSNVATHLNESNVHLLTRHYCFELKSHHTAILMRILKIFLEIALPSIVEKVSCFHGFWKTYLGSIQIFSGFIHKVRPLCRKLAATAGGGGMNSKNSSMSTGMEEEVLDAEIVNNGNYCESQDVLRPGVVHCTSTGDEHSIERQIADFMHRQLIHEVGNTSDEDSSTFYFIPMTYFDHKNEALFISVNTVLMFLRCQNCTPIVLQQRYPLLFVPWIETLLDFYFKHLIDEFPISSSHSSSCGSKHVLPLKYLSLAASAFLSNVLTCDQYADYSIYFKVNGKDTSQIKDEKAFRANQVIKTFFTPERTTALTQRLFCHMLTLSEEDLTTWDIEPERYFNTCDTLMNHVQERKGNASVHDNGGNNGMPSVVSLRFFAERLVDGLLRFNPQIITNLVNTYLSDVNRQFQVVSSSSSVVGKEKNIATMEAHNNEIFLWDNVYYCAGMCVDTLIDTLQFNVNEWLLKVMSPMFTFLLQSPHHGALLPNGQQILRSRMLWLLTKWINRIDGQLYPQILSFLVSLLHQDQQSDLVVRLRTVQAISCLINNTRDFVFDSLFPHLVAITQGLCLILQELEEIDCKVMVLNTLKDMVQLLGVTNIHSSLFISSAIGKETLQKYFVSIAQFVASVWNSLECSDVIRSNVVEVRIFFFVLCFLILNKSFGFIALVRND
jgi:hypothetical protein